MRTLKTRVRPDNIPNEKRVERGTAGRTIYLILLFVFGLAIVNYLLGDYVFLNADGLVLSDAHVIETPYVALVEKVGVDEGQSVEAGDFLLKLQSTEILERLADLSIARAGLVAKATDFKIRSESVSQLLPLAERRAAQAVKTIKQFDALAKAKLVTSARYQEALRVNYEASKDRVGLLTQRQVLKEELASLDKALADAEDAIENLRELYADGVVRSPADGSIGASIPPVGAVYQSGEPILSVYSGEPYVLAYLPRRYLFAIRVGMEVQISDGRETAHGVVSEILPVTASLPKEFQNTFKPSDRNQLAKIEIDAPKAFPLNQKVNLSRYSTLSRGVNDIGRHLSTAWSAMRSSGG